MKSSSQLLVLALVAVSCKDKNTVETDPPAVDPPTWYQDVQPIVHHHCTNCHIDNGVADRFPWSTYEETAPWATVIAQQVGDRIMPPFIADDAPDGDPCEHQFPFMHDRRLSDDEIAIVVDWADGGALEGDAGDPAPLIPPVGTSFAAFDNEVAPENGWSMGKGDISICWSLDPQIVGTEWLTGVEVVPGDNRITHHIQIQVHEDDQVGQANADPETGYWECTGVGGLGGTDFAGWLPGTAPVTMPDGIAVGMTPSSRITMQIHYHNVYDEEISDKTSLRLQYGTRPSYVEPHIFRIGNATTHAQGLLPGPADNGAPEFRIPANASGHTEEMVFTVPGPRFEFYAFMLTNHMHYAGVDMRMWVHRDPAFKEPDEPDVECLLATPRYDFGWQSFFYFDAPSRQAPVVRTGDEIRVLCTFDNTTDNALLMEALDAEGMPQIPRDVSMGAASTDEMCLGMLGAVEKAPLDAR